MKMWKKPELYVEEFELSQPIAAGCGTKTDVIVEPGGTITVGYGCHSSYPGKGHWHTDVQVYDDDKNGKIDWNEVVKYLKVADNGVTTGQGHRNHQPGVTYNGTEYWRDDQQPFTS